MKNGHRINDTNIFFKFRIEMNSNESEAFSKKEKKLNILR